jgi:hypothetical protein
VAYCADTTDQHEKERGMISSTTTTPADDTTALSAMRASVEAPHRMAEACELARRLADVLEHLRLYASDGHQAQTLRVAEGMARSVVDAVTDVMRNHPRGHIA